MGLNFTYREILSFACQWDAAIKESQFMNILFEKERKAVF